MRKSGKYIQSPVRALPLCRFHHTGSYRFQRALFPCKGRVRRGHAKERLHYFRKNYCGSLPQIILIWVFRKILPEIPWLYSPVTALLDHQQEKRLKAIRSR